MSAKADALINKFGANIAGAVAHRPSSSTPTPAPSDRYAGAIKARTFAEMPVDAIACDSQPRVEFDPDELARLAASLRCHGQLAPIRVRYDEARGSWVVLVGERRLRACRLAGLERVRVELVERPMSEADVLAEQVVENAVRADLRPVEQARAFQRLIEVNGWTAQDLAATLGVEPTRVYRALALLKLPEDVAVRVDAGAIKPTAAYELTKLDAPEAQRALAEKVTTEGLDHQATVAEVARRKAPSARRPRSRPRGVAVEQHHRGPRGVKITARLTARHTLADLVADLRALADRLEREHPREEGEAA